VDVVAGLLLALALGGIAFFSFVFSPLVFVKLPAETAGPFIRAVFPWYFLAIACVFAAAAAALAGSFPGLAVIAGVMALLGLINRQILTPRINRLRDRMTAGEAAAAAPFAKFHRASVGINLVQLFAAGLALTIILGQ
jgi:hypothetical protein